MINLQSLKDIVDRQTQAADSFGRAFSECVETGVFSDYEVERHKILKHIKPTSLITHVTNAIEEQNGFHPSCDYDFPLDLLLKPATESFQKSTSPDVELVLSKWIDLANEGKDNREQFVAKALNVASSILKPT